MQSQTRAKVAVSSVKTPWAVEYRRKLEETMAL
jgi:hypothetical protein